MTALQDKGAMQKHCEAPVGCLQSNMLPHNIQYKGNYPQRYFEAKDGMSGRFGGGTVESHRKMSWVASIPPFEGYQRSVHQQQVELRPAFYPESQKAQQNHLYALGYPYGFPVDNHFQYVPFSMSSPSYQPDNPLQEFQYFVVIDFEATCDRDKRLHPQEIIEFPSVLVNSVTGQLEDCFQIYVRPTCNRHLTDFCKELTGIQQNQVDKGVLLGDALLMHDKWLEEKGIKQTNFAVVTWGDWDCRVMLESECRFKQIRKPPYFNRWINLKAVFHEVFGGAPVRRNLKEAIELAGLVWEGRPHCGLDDAKNTAHLLTLLMHRGFKFIITNSLTLPSPELPPAACQFPQAPNSGPQQLMPLFHFQQNVQKSPAKEIDIYCHCGVKSSKRMVRKPGPKHGSLFFGCGNWTTARGAVCSYFQWVAP